MKRILFTLPVLLALAPAAAMASDDDCETPRENWRKPAELVKTLEAKGWTQVRVELDDGCYEVNAMDVEGFPVERKFDPATLEARPSDD